MVADLVQVHQMLRLGAFIYAERKIVPFANRPPSSPRGAKACIKGKTNVLIK
jgi:hypothetical protein